MSYDLYCYRSASGFPDAAEAQSIIESLNADEEAGRTESQSSTVKERLAAALIQHHSRLQRFELDYRKIAESPKISENEARARYQHIELNPPSGDLAIQLTVYDDHVFMTVPYWYQKDADRLFRGFLDDARTIHKTAGYLVYDPQTDKAFDPQKTESLDHLQYSHVVPPHARDHCLCKKPKPEETLVEDLVVLFQRFTNCTREFIGATRGLR